METKELEGVTRGAASQEGLDTIDRSKRCTFAKQDGSPCQAYAITGKDGCMFHDPETVARYKANGELLRTAASDAREACSKELARRGFRVVRNVSFDIVAYGKGGELMFVEVRASRGRNLKAVQVEALAALNRKGVRAYRYDPESGFIRPGMPAELDVPPQ